MLHGLDACGRRNAIRNSFSTSASTIPNPRWCWDTRSTPEACNDGEAVLDLLARDPRTARHLSFELAQHFVSDKPPEALVKRMVQTYLATRRRYSRGVAHHDLFPGVLVAGRPIAPRSRRPLSWWLRRRVPWARRRDVPLTMVQWTNRIGEPLYHVPAADGLLGQGRIPG